jgi:tRNA G18 (ribose-2'-O)-methylase SpoU
VERPPAPRIDDLLAPADTVLALEGIANADNVGGIFRNANALGGDAILLSPSCCDPFYRKAIRTSMGATLTVPFARVDAWPEGLLECRLRGFMVVALTPHESAPTIDLFLASAHSDPVIFLLGTEGSGLSAGAEAIAEHRVRIPMQAGVDSLNVASAAGIALYERGRHRVKTQPVQSPVSM